MSEVLDAGGHRKITASRLHGMDIYPLHRSSQIEGAAVYWIGGFEFPMPFRVRLWFLEFITRLKALLLHKGLRQENFLRFRVASEKQTERFLQTSLEYEPLAGYAIPPGGTLVKPPTAQDVEAAIKHGGFKLSDWIGDYTYWFLQKQDERQRQDFFGLGGMMLLWLPPDPNAAPPDVEMPKPAERYFAENGHNMAAVLTGLYALQDSFLARSKDVFGGEMKDDSAFAGIPFVLPLLRARHLLEATPEAMELWFSVFDGYLVESQEDGGVLLAFRDVAFDEVILEILSDMKEGGTLWPFERHDQEKS